MGLLILVIVGLSIITLAIWVETRPTAPRTNRKIDAPNVEMLLIEIRYLLETQLPPSMRQRMRVKRRLSDRQASSEVPLTELGKANGAAPANEPREAK